MTAAARIPQAEIERAVKVARKVGAGAVRVDYAYQRIEIILTDVETPPPPAENWPDDD